VLEFLLARIGTSTLMGTWAAADWAIRFYQKHGFRLVTQNEKDRLLPKYWGVPQRQIETSVVLGDQRWFDTEEVRRITSMASTAWQLNIDAWPGPNRKKWPGLRDILQECPDSRHIAVLYSCSEIDIYKEVGRFALFAGPPEAPRLLLRPRHLMCLVSHTDRAVQWIGDRYCVVTPYGIGPCWSGKTTSFGGTLYVDVKDRRAAYLADVYPGAGVPELPAGLTWRRWAWLSLWPVSRGLWRRIP
jgi:hypothetical protein